MIRITDRLLLGDSRNKSSSAGEQKFMKKKIAFDNKQITICGRAGDPYFDRLEINTSANDFLIKIVNGWLKQDAVILDVGANVGVTSCIFSIKAPNGRIHSFEPSPETYGFLCETLASNNVENCTAYQYALGAKLGELQFYDNPVSASASHLVIEGDTLIGGTMSVSISTVDRFIAEKKLLRLDLIKIDVEGFELDVLAGAENTLKTLKPAVFLEFNAFALIGFRNLNPRSVIERLMAAFPFVYAFDAGEIRLIHDSITMLAFIHDNLVKHGSVDDLFCCFDPLDASMLR